MKNFFNNINERFNNLNVTNKIKNLFNKMESNQTVSNAKEKATKTANDYTEFSKSHDSIKDNVAGNVMHRIQEAIKHMRKKFSKKNKNHEDSKLRKVMHILLKVICIIASIAFAALIIYSIKGVFLYCLKMVALSIATILSVEFILWVLGTAIGCRI